MRKVTQAAVLRHLVTTYLKGRRYFRDDQWYEDEIAIDVLYNPHSDFRRFYTPEGERYVDIYPKFIRPLMESGAIDFMPERALPPSHVCCFERDGKKFVIDGSLRIFNAIQFGVEVVPAYIHRGGE